MFGHLHVINCLLLEYITSTSSLITSGADNFVRLWDGSSNFRKKDEIWMPEPVASMLSYSNNLCITKEERARGIGAAYSCLG